MSVYVCFTTACHSAVWPVVDDYFGAVNRSNNDGHETGRKWKSVADVGTMSNQSTFVVQKLGFEINITNSPEAILHNQPFFF